MHHEEQDPRHPHHWEHQRHRRHPHHPEHFNDFRSRWGEPVPAINLHRQDWQQEDIGRFEQEGRYHREEWLPEQRQHPNHFNQHPQQQHPWEGQRPPEPIWRQRDVHFDPGNQRVEDRWYEDPTMPHPRRRPPRHYDGFWQDYED
ncbi:hypothetical protein POKO110462_08700 [Pontibacter korlensis]|uniref:Uncharacterized protein n=1 Tax=Pontibacter korlensis TaxID=400092 RepID=A0A0E3UVJ5_9BACT|nr:hypothetical protein [Pontibacter korlensis]AKD02582.1 hypothetical protein PKOR_04900 [Pontibacter korlensis]